MTEFGDILLVQAADVRLGQVEAALVTVGFRVQKVSSGLEALTLLGLTRPLFVGCELHPPDMDGHELCRRIRGLEHLATLPVGFLISEPNAEETLRGLESGADAVLCLACETALLVRRIVYLARGRAVTPDELSSLHGVETLFLGQTRRFYTGLRRAFDYLLSAHEAGQLLCPLEAPATDALPTALTLQFAEDFRNNERFLASLSHDIRDKVNAVVVLADLALDGTLSEQQRDVLRTMRPAVEGLMQPLNEMMALCRAYDHNIASFVGQAKPLSSADPLLEDLQLRILLAEDNLVNKMFVVLLLERAGHRVVAVDNGQEAIEALRREGFDLVLMDVQMPVLDGLEATAAIRQGEADVAGRTSRDVPIIALTAFAMKGDRERFLDAGMTEYLAKPLDIDKLHALLTSVKTSQAGAASAAVAGEAVVLDRARTLARLKGDEKFLSMLYETFFQDIGPRLERFRSALDSGDFVNLEKQSHSLKGVAATIDAEQVREAACDLELAAKHSNTLEARSRFAMLVERLRTLQSYIEGVAV